MSTTRPSRQADSQEGFDPRDFAPVGTRFDRDRPYPADPRPQRPGSDLPWRRWALVGLAIVSILAAVAIGTYVLAFRTDTPTAQTDPVAQVADEPATASEPAAPASEATATSPSEVLPDTTTDTVTPPAIANGDVPADTDLRAASAFALQFANTYLSYDSEALDVREQQLAGYLAEGLDSQLGWSGEGRQAAGLTIPLGAERTTEGLVEVVLAAQVTGPRAPRWVHLAVTLDADDEGRWAVVRQPAFVPPPPAGRPSLPGTEPVDEQLGEALTSGLTRVMAAYGSDPTVQLAGLTDPDATIRGLGGQFELAEVTDVAVHEGGPDERTATVTVRWDSEVTGGSLTQPYSLTLVDRAGTWLVAAIEPA